MNLKKSTTENFDNNSFEVLLSPGKTRRGQKIKHTSLKSFKGLNY